MNPKLRAATEFAPNASEPSVAPSTRPNATAAAAAVACEIVAGTASLGIDHYLRALTDEKESVSTQAARVLEETLAHKPQLLAPHVERLVRLLGAERTRVAQCAARALAELARVTPAKVAKHLDTLAGSWNGASAIGKDARVRTFVALCLASVTYQRRVIDVFQLALREADAKALPQWAELILPALKGEPYAQARAVVERRLGDGALPGPAAQRLALLLGIKWRALPR